ncbi:hypothetical protein [Shewanella woodyi]|uniref:hypothetical protein n=1 Tax=Shewanella woodyi TaxID=60961 RepID=UPI0007F95F86|nr:hypothetical protein [Shewanella woodyi]
MNEINIIRATQERKFERISSKISNAYNSYFGKSESFNINEPRNLFVIHPDGIKGGIVVSKIYGYKNSATILVAGFKEEDRNKGYLKACISEANKLLKKYNLNLVAVTLNPTDDEKVWKKMGFNTPTIIEGMHHLLSIKKSELS